MSDETESRPVESKWGPASFEVDGETVKFAVWQTISRDCGLREVPRAVPFVDGEQIDETGLTAPVWEVHAIFANDLVNEDGIGDETPLYPDRLEALEKLFDRKKTGTFNGLFRRNVRCKAIRWRRVHTVEAGECGQLDITFKEDNEAKLDAPRAAGVSAHVNLREQIKEATFEAERAGQGGGSWEQLTELASQLETLINTPSEIRGNIAQKATRVVAICDSMLDTIERNEEAVGFSDPATDAAYRALWNFRWLAENAEEQAREGRPEVVVVITKNPTSLYEIAVAAGKDIGAVLDLNPQIEDPNDVDPKTPVNLPK